MVALRVNDRIELVRQELRLRREIAAHELQCLADDDADPAEFEEKLEEILLIDARRDDLERRFPRPTAGW